MSRIIVVISAVASVLLLSLIYARMAPAPVAGSADPTPAASVADTVSSPAPAAVVEKDPNAPPYVLRDPTAPPLMPGDVHDIDLYAVEAPMTVADGFVQMTYSFSTQEGVPMVPGPVIRVKVGDTVRIHLHNPASNTMPHSIDFHASMVAWNDEMTDIQPGEEKLYEYTANYAGVWMYHCGTAGVLSHLMNGMYGMVIVEPKEGLPPVDHEFFIVQSEWYLGPQGQIGNFANAQATVANPDFVVFNGVANQYKDNPIQVPTGERVRVFVIDDGPSLDSSFHIVGTIFDQVRKEGVLLARGNDGNWASQAVDLSPAQAAIVEFSFAEDGLYPMVTHAFNLPAHGAVGLFQAGDGDPTN